MFVREEAHDPAFFRNVFVKLFLCFFQRQQMHTRSIESRPTSTISKKLFDTYTHTPLSSIISDAEFRLSRNKGRVSMSAVEVERNITKSSVLVRAATCVSTRKQGYVVLTSLLAVPGYENVTNTAARGLVDHTARNVAAEEWQLNVQNVLCPDFTNKPVMLFFPRQAYSQGSIVVSRRKDSELLHFPGFRRLMVPAAWLGNLDARWCRTLFHETVFTPMHSPSSPVVE